MKIALVSPGHIGGGKVYSKKLSEALNASVISAALPLHRIWSRVLLTGFDVVDVQLEYRSFGSHLRTITSLPILTLLLRNITTTVVTVHGVLTHRSLRNQRFRGLKWLVFVVSIRLAALFSHIIVVHSEQMKRELIAYGVRNVVVVPHGSGPLSYQAQEASRKAVLFFGFIRPSKGLEPLISAFKHITRTYPSAPLIIAGDVNEPSDIRYLDHLHALVRQLGLEASVRFRTTFVPEAEKKSLAAQSAVLVLPYTDSFVEVSGVVHDFAGYGLSLVCSTAPRFAELRDGFECLKVEVTSSELEDSICRLLGDVDLRERLAWNLSKRARSESWESVANTRLALYRNILPSKSRTDLARSKD